MAMPVRPAGAACDTRAGSAPTRMPRPNPVSIPDTQNAATRCGMGISNPWPTAPNSAAPSSVVRIPSRAAMKVVPVHHIATPAIQLSVLPLTPAQEKEFVGRVIIRMRMHEAKLRL